MILPGDRHGNVSGRTADLRCETFGRLGFDSVRDRIQIHSCPTDDDGRKSARGIEFKAHLKLPDAGVSCPDRSWRMPREPPTGCLPRPFQLPTMHGLLRSMRMDRL